MKAQVDRRCPRLYVQELNQVYVMAHLGFPIIKDSRHTGLWAANGRLPSSIQFYVNDLDTKLQRQDLCKKCRALRALHSHVCILADSTLDYRRRVELRLEAMVNKRHTTKITAECYL